MVIKWTHHLKCTIIWKQRPEVLLEMLRFIRVTFIVLISSNRLQFGADDGTKCCRVWYHHYTDDRVCVLRPIQASGKHKEAERQALAGENEHQQVCAHCPVVIDEARTFVTLTCRLLPRHARFVDQKSKQDWSWYHTYINIHDSTSWHKMFSKKYICNSAVFTWTPTLLARLTRS